MEYSPASNLYGAHTSNCPVDAVERLAYRIERYAPEDDASTAARLAANEALLDDSRDL